MNDFAQPVDIMTSVCLEDALTKLEQSRKFALNSDNEIVRREFIGRIDECITKVTRMCDELFELGDV